MSETIPAATRTPGTLTDAALLAGCAMASDYKAPADPAPLPDGFVHALGTGYAQGLGFSEVEILRGEHGAPRLVLHGLARARAESLGITTILVSITHTRRDAHAVAVGEERVRRVDRPTPPQRRPREGSTLRWCKPLDRTRVAKGFGMVAKRPARAGPLRRPLRAARCDR